jgi:predicted metal-dependent enzyme (double-stranded beta helix superfamily)
MKVSEQGLAKRHHNALMKWMADATLLADIDDVLDASIDNQITNHETQVLIRDLMKRFAVLNYLSNVSAAIAA